MLEVDHCRRNVDMTVAQVSERSDIHRSLIYWLIAAALFVGFFFFEQDVRTSTYDDFVPDVEIREAWSEGGSVTRQLSILGLGALGGICFLLPSPKRIKLTDPLLMIAAVYFAYIAASYSWSIDPEATKRRLIVLGIFVVAALGVGRQVPTQLIPELTMICMLGYLLLGIACEIGLGTFRPWSGEHRFAGTTHPNIQASYLVVMCLAAWAVHRQPGPFRPWALMIMVAGLVFLYLTRSRTSAGGFALAFVFAGMVVADRFRAFRFGFAVFWSACLAAILVLALGSNITGSAEDVLRMGRREAAVEEASSLTGRLPLWTELWNYVEDKPLYGHGYEAFWTTDNFVAVASEIDWGPATAHNSFLECLLDLGYVGLAVMLAAVLTILLKLMWNAARDRQPHQQFVLAVFVYALIFGMTEAGIRSPSTATFFGVIGVIATLLYRTGTAESQRYEVAQMRHAS